MVRSVERGSDHHPAGVVIGVGVVPRVRSRGSGPIPIVSIYLGIAKYPAEKIDTYVSVVGVGNANVRFSLSTHELMFGARVRP